MKAVEVKLGHETEFKSKKTFEKKRLLIPPNSDLIAARSLLKEKNK